MLQLALQLLAAITVVIVPLAIVYHTITILALKRELRKKGRTE